MNRLILPLHCRLQPLPLALPAVRLLYVLPHPLGVPVEGLAAHGALQGELAQLGGHGGRGDTRASLTGGHFG